MKKQYLWLEFCIVFIFLIIPPLCTNSSNTNALTYRLSLLSFVQLAIGMLLDFQNKSAFASLQNGRAVRRSYFVYLSYGAITFGSLMLIFAFLQGIALLFPNNAADSLLSNMPAPSGVKEWIVCVFALMASAYYEEVLYRQFLPTFLLFLIPKGNGKKWSQIGIESICVLIFAFSHRYLGWIAVFNAAACGTVLRFCCKKTCSVYTGAVSHFMYNLLMYIFLSF